MKGIIALILFITLIVLIIYNPFKVQSERTSKTFEKNIKSLFSDIPKNATLSYESFIKDQYILPKTRFLITPRLLVHQDQDTSLIILYSNDSIPSKYSEYRIIEARKSDSLNLLLISKI